MPSSSWKQPPSTMCRWGCFGSQRVEKFIKTTLLPLLYRGGGLEPRGVLTLTPTMKKSIIAFSLAAVFVLSTQTQAAVQLQTPTGLAAGDTFRFIFLTQDTITGTSADISTYDTFVNSQAGGAQYQGATISWSAIISTSTIDARDHVGGYGTNFPVFRIDGTRIANSLTTDSAGNGLWTMSVLASPSFGIDGAAVTGSTQAWTGSNSDGTKNSFNPVGAPEFIYNGTTYAGTSNYGSTFYTNSFWLRETNASNTSSLRVYGMSEQLTVIPEPSSLGLLALGAVGLVARRKR